MEMTISTERKLQSSLAESDGTKTNADFSRENTSGESRNEMKGESDEEEDADHEKTHENRIITSTLIRKSARKKRSSSISDSRKMNHVKKKRIKNNRNHGYRILYAKDEVSSKR